MKISLLLVTVCVLISSSPFNGIMSHYNVCQSFTSFNVRVIVNSHKSPFITYHIIQKEFLVSLSSISEFTSSSSLVTNKSFCKKMVQSSMKFWM